MKQMTLAMAGLEKHGKPTRREKFLAEMERVVPWARLCALIEPHYPKGHRGRPPIGVERMLRIHLVQHWFNLSDPALEDALIDIPCLRAFVGIDLGREAAPDETTICKFRHLLEAHRLADQIFAEVNAYLADQGMKVSTGTIVDATLISAPTSTKNQARLRDPEMHQTKKGNEWYFGMKAHIGVDSQTKLMHSLAVTPANISDTKLLPVLLHGEERRVYGDGAYMGQGAVIAAHAPKAKDFTNRRAVRYRKLTEGEKRANHTKSKVRAKVEHPFLIIKRVFGFAKVRYRGLFKNAQRLFVAAALANLYMVRRRLLRLQGA